MSILGAVTAGAPPMGLRMVLAAAEKVGKSTFACDAPAALLIPMEIGYAGLRDVQKTPMLTAWHEVCTLQQEIYKSCMARQFPFKTLVWDTGTALEAMIHKHVIALDPGSKKNPTASMETTHGGYGKAYPLADGIFREFLAFCDTLAMQFGINTIVTCHVFANKVLDPVQGEYHAYDLLLHSPKNEKTYGKREIIAQWADVIGYLFQPMMVQRSDKQSVQQAIGISDGRCLSIERTPSNVAGNRFGMKGEIRIPPPPANGWNYFAHALYEASGIDVFNRAKP